jgi:hypothetical protein
MQAIARTTLTSLGIMTMSGMAYTLPMGGTQTPSALLHTLFSLFYLLLQGGILYVLVLDNTALARKITPTVAEEEPAPLHWCETVLRLGMILCGLLLFMGTGKYLLQALAFLVLPTGLRQFMQDAIAMGFLSALKTWGDIKAQLAIWHTALSALAVYLICGAPHLVRWQIHQTQKNTKAHPTVGEVS